MRSLMERRHRPPSSQLLLLLALMLSLVSSCSDSEGEEGSRCDQDQDCATDFCLREVGVDEGLCASGAADGDGDGLSNAEELRRGTSPTRRDSDQDGVDDGDEPEDCDGDGRIDALESGRGDADGDGVPDPYDQDDAADFCPSRELPVPGVSEGGCVPYSCRARLTCDGTEIDECPAGQQCVEGLNDEGATVAFCEAVASEDRDVEGPPPTGLDAGEQARDADAGVDGSTP